VPARPNSTMVCLRNGALRLMSRAGTEACPYDCEGEVEVDGYFGEGDWLDDAAAVVGHGVGAVRLATPGGECSLDGVEVPDLAVAARLIGGEFFGDVHAAGGRRPDFGDEREGVGDDVEFRARSSQSRIMERGMTKRSGM
jgi:hypothetical protein